MAMSFHDWMKSLNSNPEKAARIESIAREAEEARERDEDIALELNHQQKFYNCMYADTCKFAGSIYCMGRCEAHIKTK